MTMHSTDTAAAPQLSRSWMVASLAFAFLLGVCLSIPLLNGMSLAPTGYDPAISSEKVAGTGGSAQSIIEKEVPGACLNCAVRGNRVPTEASPFAVDPHVAFRGSEGVDV